MNGKELALEYRRITKKYGMDIPRIKKLIEYYEHEKLNGKKVIVK